MLSLPSQDLRCETICALHLEFAVRLDFARYKYSDCLREFIARAEHTQIRNQISQLKCQSRKI